MLPTPGLFFRAGELYELPVLSLIGMRRVVIQNYQALHVIYKDKMM